MAQYSLKLTPDLVNPGSEGSLDTSLVNGVSIQRTANMLEVLDLNGNRKVVSLKDLQDITNWKPITILRAVAPLIIKRKIKALTHEHTRYFKIIDKPL
jgi:hypothetical protein